MSVADTNTQLLPPAELTEEALAALDWEAGALVRAALSAESPTLVMEDAHALARPAYRARHRVEDREPWDPNPLFFPHEETRELGAQRQAVVAVPLPSRDPGVALAEVEAPARANRLLAVVMGAAQRLRGVLGVRDGAE